MHSGNLSSANIEETLSNIKEMVTGNRRNAPQDLTEDGSIFVLTDIVKKGKNIPKKVKPQKENPNNIKEIQELINSIQTTSQSVTSKVEIEDFNHFIKQTLQSAIDQWVQKNLPELMHTAIQNTDFKKSNTSSET